MRGVETLPPLSTDFCFFILHFDSTVDPTDSLVIVVEALDTLEETPWLGALPSLLQDDGLGADKGR